MRTTWVEKAVANPGKIARLLGRMAGGTLSLLAPPRCRFCQAPLLGHENPFLCRRCAASMPWIGDGACRGCGFPAGPHARHGDRCDRCRGKKLNLTGAAAVTRYGLGARSLVRGLKFRNETEIAGPMAGLMAARLRNAGFGGVDVLLPVALHPARRRKRGFDQAGLLCRRIAALTGIPARPELLERIRHTEPQTLLRREARLRNMDGAFRASGELAGKSVLLVDDVMTTGATMGECARACRDAGARRVYALVFAR